MEKNKRNKIIGLSIGILVVLIIVVSSTYAYWQITETQTTPNDIVAACLSLDLNDADVENTGINLDSAWPISDEEAQNLTGYTFTVTNNCNEEINYIVGLNRVEEETANYLLDSSIKLQLDDNSSFTYSDLSDVEYADVENTEYTARASKQVSVETIGAKGTNTHTIRIWVSEDAPVTEQSKTFLGQVFITGGQGIEMPSCFTIANNGIIMAYDYSCGTDVVIPAEINGIKVKSIERSSFDQGDVALISLTNTTTQESEFIVYYKNDTQYKEQYELYLKQIFCEDPATCNLGDVVTLFNSLEEVAAYDFSNYISEMGYSLNYNAETEEFKAALVKLNLIDLSEASYLESIGWLAFGLSSGLDTEIDENCTLVEDEKEGNYYDCKATLKEVKLPQNGVLSSIGFEAFNSCQLSEVIIPASVTSIEEQAFDNNDGLTTVIIKNTEGNVTLGSNAFPSAATITYNPDYTE